VAVAKKKTKKLKKKKKLSKTVNLKAQVTPL
jgi:hypothetical protein